MNNKNLKELYFNIKIVISSLEKINRFIINSEIDRVLAIFIEYMKELKTEVEKEASKQSITL